MIYSKAFSWQKTFAFNLSLTEVWSWGTIDKKSALTEVMFYDQTGNKPSIEPSMTKFYDIMKCHKATVS